MKAYRVQVIHQVTETYNVEAESREDAWHRVERFTGAPLDAEAGQYVRLARTDHGPREVWDIRRDVEDVPSVVLVDAEPCVVCGNTMAQCATMTGRCCGYCHHPARMP